MKQYQELSNTELRNTSGGFTFIIPVPVWQLKVEILTDNLM